MSLAIVILAAGKGTRMRSQLPKVLHPLGGKPLLHHVIDTARSFSPEEIVVVTGHGADQVRADTPGEDIHWVLQDHQAGTAHAVDMALPHVSSEKVLVLYGDVPLISQASLSRVIARISDHSMAVLTFGAEDPTGYGRIIRDDEGTVSRIIEHKDASISERQIAECNSGIIGIGRKALSELITRVGNENAQGEYYLTDIIGLFAEQYGQVIPVTAESEQEVLGVNNRSQLASLERIFQYRQAEHLMDQGLGLMDNHRFDLRGVIEAFGQDCVIDINCVLVGQITLGNNVSIGPNCLLSNCTIGDNVSILANSVIENSTVGAHAIVGPFARLRPGTVLESYTKVGNFVETKNAQVASGSKINHLSYIGDTVMGRAVNIGAGTITCNYDGANKHKTEIGDHVFVGSNSALVAPVKLGENATIGAGSTITKDVEGEHLAVARSRQVLVKGWKRPEKGN
ncbi:MAG: bifunctional UDP-N-acetylglucosamine diphosphorylase/glucosamine-1-phosphate N-acetyltransferase GlmU [Thiotrichales bacterium]